MKTRTGLALAAVILAIAAPASSSSSAEVPVPSLPWLHEGLVLTFTWYAAVAPGNGSDYQEDAQGEWVDRNGNRFTRSTQQGTSGSGWSQITVACIDGDKAVLSLASFGNAGSLGRNQPVPQQGGESAVAPVGNPGDYWMDPNRLAGLHNGQTMLATHVSWRAGDHMTDAIRVQMIKDGNYDEHVYDARTGICLHFAGSVRGASPRYVGPGDFGKGNTTLTHGDFVGARDISVPWAREAMPSWVQQLRELHYRGPIISRGPLPSTNSVYFADLQVLSEGRGWVELSAVSGAQMQGAPNSAPSRGKIAFGRNQFAGLWAGPEALAKLQRGQVLDQDPITKMRTVVAKVDGRSVVISSSNAAGEIDSEYDMHTGMLIANSFYNVLAMQQWTLRLQ